MKFRIVGAGVAVVLAVTSLTACRSNVGVAARVDGETISESQITTYLAREGQDPEALSQAKAAGQSLIPARVLVLRFEITDRLLDRALKSNGGLPTDAQLDTVRDAALTSQGSAPPTDAQLRTDLGRVGVRSGFLSTFLHVSEKELVLANRLRFTSPQDRVDALDKAGVKVSVSPRYGTWDPKTLEVTSSGGAGLPDFVTLQPQRGVAADAAPAGN